MHKLSMGYLKLKTILYPRVYTYIIYNVGKPGPSLFSELAAVLMTETEADFLTLSTFL
jgi:hypothetical protein